MKNSLSFATVKNILILLLAIAGSLFIWYAGPLIAFADSTPLAAAENRIWGIVIFLAFLVLLMLLLRPSRQPSSQNSQQKYPEFAKLREQFKGAVEFLKKTSVNHINEQDNNAKQKLYNLPWFLVMGEKESGQTSLLTNSGLKFLLSKKKPSSSSSKKYFHCDWWGTKQAIFIDVNSAYTLQEKSNRRIRALWLDFMQLLNKHRAPAINGLIITINLQRFTENSKKEQMLFINNIKKRLLDINKHLGLKHYPIYIVFNKCDILAGFSEFFESLAVQDRQQAWGISFTQSQIAHPQQLAETFDTQFDIVLKKLNERLIQRLHQEPSLGKRTLIKDFPLQVESLKNPIAVLLKQISGLVTSKCPGKLRGLYFTAAEPQKETVDRLLQPLKNTFALQVHNEDQYTRPKQAYFTAQLFRHIIFRDTAFFTSRTQTQQTANHWFRRLALVSAVILITAITVRWAHDYRQTIQQINQAEDAVAEYKFLAQQSQFATIDDALNGLNHLQQAATILANINQHWLINYTSEQPDLLATAQQAYLHSMQNVIKLQLENSIQRQLSTPDNLDPARLYGALKCYLMLNNPDKFDPLYLQRWLAKDWQQVNPAQQAALKQHLQAFIATPPQQHMALKTSLINPARQAFAQQPLAAQALAILNNEFVDADDVLTLSIPDGHGIVNVFATPEQALTISKIYTAAKFTESYEELIPQAAQQAVHGNWVTKDKPDNTNNPIQLDKLVEQTRDQYIASYINTWQHVLAELKLAEVTKLEQAIQLIDSLLQNNSALSHLLWNIYSNTNVTYKNIQTPISIRFQQFNKFYGQFANGNPAVFKANLVRLQDYLANIANAQSVPFSAYTAARSRMLMPDVEDDIDRVQKQAQQSPYPINEWINTIALSSWQIILQHAQDYLQTIWSNRIYPEYASHINQHYPFFTDATTDTELENFQQFFGPDSQLTNFTNQALIPFINTDHKTWSLRQRNGLTLPVAIDFIGQIQQAQTIQHTFFNQSNDVTFSFGLKPEALQPVVKTMKITIDGKQALYTQSKTAEKTFLFPAQQPKHSAQIKITSIDGQEFQHTETGLWAWLKLLDQARPVLNPVTKKLDLTFELNGYGARFSMNMENAAPAFEPDLLHTFRCPENIG